MNLTKSILMDYSQSIQVFQWEASPQDVGYPPNGFGSVLSRAYPGKLGVLIWQLCEIQTAMLRKYHARVFCLSDPNLP
jgi:hypothetical protein